MNRANTPRSTGSIGSVIGLSLSRTARLWATISYSVSNGAIEKMLPAPSTSPTPPLSPRRR